MYAIKTLDKIDPKGLHILPQDSYQVTPDCQNPDAIILRSYNMHDMELPENLKAIARAGAGYNNIPVEKCTGKGIVVFNTPGANANGVKELVIAGMLLASRDIAGSIVWARSLVGQGDQVPELVEKGKKNYGGTEILGKTLAVIGLGAIGTLVANSAQTLGMKVLGYDPYISVKQALKLSNNIQLTDSLETLLNTADYISLHLPLTSETKGYINKEKFTLMKKHVRLLNFARGELVNTADLAEALESCKVYRYVTDFPDENVLKLKNVIGIPHLGASTEESEINCAIMAVDQVKEYLEKGTIHNSVNFPQAEMDMHGGARFIVANRNTPNIINQISNIFANESLNIAGMLNRNRNEITYNIIDIDKKEVDSSVAAKLMAIEGVFLVRVI